MSVVKFFYSPDKYNFNKSIKCGIVAKREVFIKPVKYWPFLKIRGYENKMLSKIRKLILV